MSINRIMVRATHYSGIVAAHGLARHRGTLRVARLCALLAVSLFLPRAGAAGAHSPAAYAKGAFLSAQENLRAHPDAPKAASEFARRCFDWAEFATNNAQRAELANAGIAAAEAAIKASSNSAAAHYYLAKNLGQLARTKTLGALPLVDRMEAEFKRARALDEKLDHAGPDRFLGLLYFEAPVIASVGSRSKARRHFNRAAELDPDYPENRLHLIEAAIRWKELKTAHHELEALEKKLPAARARFSGEEWTAAWLDWDQRLETARSTMRQRAGKPPN